MKSIFSKMALLSSLVLALCCTSCKSTKLILVEPESDMQVRLRNQNGNKMLTASGNSLSMQEGKSGEAMVDQVFNLVPTTDSNGKPLFLLSHKNKFVKASPNSFVLENELENDFDFSFESNYVYGKSSENTYINRPLYGKTLLMALAVAIARDSTASIKSRWTYSGNKIALDTIYMSSSRLYGSGHPQLWRFEKVDCVPIDWTAEKTNLSKIQQRESVVWENNILSYYIEPRLSWHRALTFTPIASVNQLAAISDIKGMIHPGGSKEVKLPGQQFRFVSNEDGTYSIVNQKYDYALEYGSCLQNGKLKVYQSRTSTSENQKFVIEWSATTSSHYKLRAASANLYLDVRYTKDQNISFIEMAEESNAPTQEFDFIQSSWEATYFDVGTNKSRSGFRPYLMKWRCSDYRNHINKNQERGQPHSDIFYISYYKRLVEEQERNPHLSYQGERLLMGIEQIRRNERHAEGPHEKWSWTHSLAFQPWKQFSLVSFSKNAQGNRYSSSLPGRLLVYGDRVPDHYWRKGSYNRPSPNLTFDKNILCWNHCDDVPDGMVNFFDLCAKDAETLSTQIAFMSISVAELLANVVTLGASGAGKQATVAPARIAIKQATRQIMRESVGTVRDAGMNYLRSSTAALDGNINHIQTKLEEELGVSGILLDALFAADPIGIYNVVKAFFLPNCDCN